LIVHHANEIQQCHFGEPVNITMSSHAVQQQLDAHPQPKPGAKRWATKSGYPHKYGNKNEEGPTHTPAEMARLHHGDGKLYEYPIVRPGDVHFNCNRKRDDENQPGRYRITTDSRKVTQGAMYHYGGGNNFRRGNLEHIKQPIPKRPIVTF
jgi:hypothetical protein